MKKLNNFLVTALVLTGITATAQVKVGDNPTTINSSALLEMESTNKGLLLPRVALTSSTAAAPLTAHVEGMTVYNTSTAGSGALAVTPGEYYNDGTKWIKKQGTSEVSFTRNVFVNGTDPNVATQFDEATLYWLYNAGTEACTVNVAFVHDPTTQQDPSALYIAQSGCDANFDGAELSYWIWNGTAYVPYQNSADSNFFLALTEQGAGNNKNLEISRTGNITITHPTLGKSVRTSLGSIGLSFTRPSANYIQTLHKDGYISFSTPSLPHGIVIRDGGLLGIGHGASNMKAKLAVNGYIKLGSADTGADDTSTTNAERTGMMRYSTTNLLELHNGTEWKSFDNTSDSWSQNGTTGVFTADRVGIGTSIPTANLDVLGSAKFNSVAFTSFGINVGAGVKQPVQVYDTITQLQDGFAYEITLTTGSTTTITGAKYLVYKNTGIWNVKLVSLNNDISNSPLLQLNTAGNGVEMYHNHTGTYAIYARTKRYAVYTLNLAPSFFGLEGIMTNIKDNVGIGTATPLNKLHVVGGIRSGLDGNAQHIYAIANSTQAFIDFKSDNATVSGNIGFDYINNRMFINTAQVVNTVMNTFGGNVGVGTVTPTERLEVNGAIKIGTRADAGATVGTIRFNTTTNKFQGQIGVGQPGADANGWVNLH